MGDQIPAIHLDNFDPLKREPPYLTSPRSIEACKLNGIDPTDLLKRDINYFQQLRPQDDIKLIEIRNASYEKMRCRLLQKAQEERYTIMLRDKKKEEGAVIRSIEDIRKDFEESILNQEKAYMEKLKRRQEKELKQVMLYEIHVEAMQQRKMKEQEETEQREADERERKRIQKRREEERKMKRDRLAREKAHQKELEEKKLEARQFEVYKMEAKAKEEAKIQERKIRELKEAEHTKKLEEFAKKTDELFKAQEMKFAEKDRVIKERAEERLRVLAERKKKQDRIAERNRIAYQRKVDRVAERKIQQEEKMKEETRKRLEHGEKVVEEFQRKAEEDRKMMKAKKDAKRKKIRDNYNKKQNSGFNQAMGNLAEREAVFQKMKEDKRQELKFRSDVRNIKYEEVSKFLNQKEASRNYHMEKLEATLAFQEERFQMRKKAQESMIFKRIEANRDAFNKRGEILEEFSKMMNSGKMTEKELEDAVCDILGLENDSASTDDNDKRSQTNTDISPLTTEIKDTITNVSREAPIHESVKDEPIAKELQENDKLFTRANDNSTIDTMSINTSKNTDQINVNGKKKPQGPLKPLKKSYKPKIPTELAYDMLESLRKAQNEELLSILAEEQTREKGREKLLATMTDQTERLKLETVTFAKERAEASERIIKLTENHENQLSNRRIELGLPPPSLGNLSPKVATAGP